MNNLQKKNCQHIQNIVKRDIMESSITTTIHQQIIISGVGGQGVLLISRLLAEAAMIKGCRVLTSETHGMAQRGGTVVSHLKVGEFSSPLIRPQAADGLLALKPESLAQYSNFIKPGGWAVVNSPAALSGFSGLSVTAVDADAKAGTIGNPKSVNLVLMGAALSLTSEGVPLLFCSLSDIQMVLREQFSNAPETLEKFLAAVEAGFSSCRSF